MLAISQSTADDLTTLLGVPASKIDVTPLGYDKAAFRPLQSAEIEHFRHKHNLPERFWLFLGTVEPRKNLPLLLRAYAGVPRAERLPLILGGGIGWMADETFRVIERLELGDTVNHVGFIPAADLPLWYNCAETFVYPSVYEGFGLPVLEAMACGTPVLTSDVSSLPEVAGKAGYCLPPDDVERWTDALRDIERDGDWRQSARIKGLERAKQFSWARTAELTRASYRQALAAREVSALEAEKVSRVEGK